MFYLYADYFKNCMKTPRRGTSFDYKHLVINVNAIRIFNNYWMRLSGISRIIEAEVGVIFRSRRLRQITLTEASIILDIPRKPNSIIILLFTWNYLSFILCTNYSLELFSFILCAKTKNRIS